MKCKVFATFWGVFLLAAGEANALTGFFYSADILQDTTLRCPAIIERPIFVRNDATLTIPAGCIVRGQPRSGPFPLFSIADAPGAIVVTESGRISAIGNPRAPVIFTTCAVDEDRDGQADDSDGNGFPDKCNSETADTRLHDADPVNAPLAPLSATGRSNAGLWGGLSILGNAPTNLAGKCVGGYGTCSPLIASTPYGGVNPHDDSGTLRFASIRHAGAQLLSEQTAGLLLGGVGAGTTIEDVEVYASYADGIAWLGGTVHAKRLAVWLVGEDMFDVDEGYTGVVQFVLGVAPWFNETASTCASAVPSAPYGANSGNDGLELEGDDYADGFANVNIRRESDTQLVGADNNAGDRTPWPLSFASFYNVTLIGSTVAVAQRGSGSGTVTGAEFPGPNALCASKRGFNVRNGWAGTIFNSIVVNTSSEEGLEINPDNAHDGDAAFPCPAGSPETGTAVVGREGAPCFGADENVINTSTPWASTSAGLTKLVCSTFDDTGTLDAIETEAATDGNGLSESLRGISPTVTSDDNVINGSFTNLVNEDQTFDPQGVGGKLVGLRFKKNLLDPRPQGLVGSSGCVAPKGPGRENTTFRGAFAVGAPSLWTTPWSVMAQGRVIAD